VAKPNYAFEKRQREQQKKRKAEEKAQRKSQPGTSQPEPGEVPAQQVVSDTSSPPLPATSN